MYARKNRDVLGSAGHAFDGPPPAPRRILKAANRGAPSGTESLPVDDPLIRSATEDMTQEQRQELRTYVRDHPEIRTILQDFVANVLADKPDDTVAFAREYFTSLNQ
jgi:hypothetical protein